MSVALVFRSIGERTSELALELAKKNLAPDEIHILSDVRPFSEAIRQMIELDFKSDQIVAVDADCLILEDMRPWLDRNTQGYVDCYVQDRFRQRLHCGVHVTRADVMAEMKRVATPSDDPAYVLRPESRMRKLALNRLGVTKSFKSFSILHDHFQWYRDVWAKYALRELRSRTEEGRRKLEFAMGRWRSEEGEDFRVALAGVEWARSNLAPAAPASALSVAINQLQVLSAGEISKLGIEERTPLAEDEVWSFAKSFERRWPHRADQPKVFGLGLSRTGTRSLTAALHILGVDTVHYPVDADSLRALESGKLDFGLLENYDGLTDITVSAYYEDLLARYPDAKFILTHRDEASWLRSCRNHWSGRSAYERAEERPGKGTTESRATHHRIRRFLRAAVYGSYDYAPERFARVRKQHQEAVRRFFADKPGKLLELSIVEGEGFEKLCPFLDRAIPEQPFPHKGGALSARIRREVGDPDD